MKEKGIFEWDRDNLIMFYIILGILFLLTAVPLMIEYLLS